VKVTILGCGGSGGVPRLSAPGLRVHTPLGPRKSGMPLSVLMPAPVSTTTRPAASIQRRAWAIRSACTSDTLPGYERY